MAFDAAHVTGLLSAVFGAAGTVVLFFNSWSVQPPEGAIFGGPAVDETNRKIREANATRQNNQLWGLALILGSFILQGISVILTP